MDNKIIDNKSIFCNNLRELRSEKQLSQRELAKTLGVPVSTYANWEQGRRDPGVNDIFNIMNALGVEANELFSPPYGQKEK